MNNWKTIDTKDMNRSSFLFNVAMEVFENKMGREPVLERDADLVMVSSIHEGLLYFFLHEEELIKKIKTI